MWGIGKFRYGRLHPLRRISYHYCVRLAFAIFAASDFEQFWGSLKIWLFVNHHWWARIWLLSLKFSVKNYRRTIAQLENSWISYVNELLMNQSWHYSLPAWIWIVNPPRNHNGYPWKFFPSLAFFILDLCSHLKRQMRLTTSCLEWNALSGDAFSFLAY